MSNLGISFFGLRLSVEFNMNPPSSPPKLQDEAAVDLHQGDVSADFRAQQVAAKNSTLQRDQEMFAQWAAGQGPYVPKQSDITQVTSLSAASVETSLKRFSMIGS